MSEIKPIETKYKGYRFRSRLEARWAVFFDTMGIEWKYETDGFDIDGGWYLPDFFLPYKAGGPSWGYWVEIKPTSLDQDQAALLDGLARITGHRSFAICGDPWPQSYQVSMFEHYHGDQPNKFPLHENGVFYQLEMNIDCEKSLSWNEFGASFGGHRHSLLQWPIVGDDEVNRAMLSAFEAARAARFEHGETPQ